MLHWFLCWRHWKNPAVPLSPMQSLSSPWSEPSNWWQQVNDFQNDKTGLIDSLAIEIGSFGHRNQDKQDIPHPAHIIMNNLLIDWIRSIRTWHQCIHPPNFSPIIVSLPASSALREYLASFSVIWSVLLIQPTTSLAGNSFSKASSGRFASTSWIVTEGSRSSSSTMRANDAPPSSS